MALCWVLFTEINDKGSKVCGGISHCMYVQPDIDLQHLQNKSMLVAGKG